MVSVMLVVCSLSCSTNTSCAFLFFSAAMPFLYSSSVKGNTSEESSSLIGDGQVGLGVGSWLSNRATEGSNPKGTRLYFVISLKNVEKIFDWH